MGRAALLLLPAVLCLLPLPCGGFAHFGDPNKPKDPALVRRADKGDAAAQFTLAKQLVWEDLSIDGTHSDGALGTVAYSMQSMPDMDPAKANLMMQEAQGRYEKAAQGGHAEAQYQIGVLTMNNGGPEPFEWVRKSALAGHPPAQVLVGEAYRTGQQGVARSLEQAESWFTKAKDQKSHVAFRGLGLVAMDRNDVTEAVKWYRAGAKEGDPTCKYNLGNLYLQGLGDLPPDTDIALKWFERAAEGGDLQGMCNAGLMYMDGPQFQFESDKKKGMGYLVQAVDHGLPRCEYSLGLGLIRGFVGTTNIEKDRKEGADLLLRSAEKGFLWSQYALGMHLLSKGKKKAAQKWVCGAGDKQLSIAKRRCRLFKKGKFELKSIAKGKKQKEWYWDLPNDVTLHERAEEAQEGRGTQEAQATEEAQQPEEETQEAQEGETLGEVTSDEL